MKTDKKYTYVTLLSTDSYLMGVLLLAKSLREAQAKYPLLVVCSNGVSDKTKRILTRYGLEYVALDEAINVDTTKYNVAPGYEHWNNTLDKLYVFSLTDYDKVIFLDSDMMVVRNIDHLFDMPHMSAVVADVFNEPDLRQLNSGMIVIEPNKRDFEGMVNLWTSGGIKLPNAGDQDVIRAWFKDWENHPELRLAQGYNVFYSDCRTLVKPEQVEPVYVIHYIGPRKPWQISVKAMWRRSRNNFLGKLLLRYAKNLYMLRINNFYYEHCDK